MATLEPRLVVSGSEYNVLHVQPMEHLGPEVIALLIVSRVALISQIHRLVRVVGEVMHGI